MKKQNTLIRLRRAAAFLLCILLAAAVIAPVSIQAKSTTKNVRVGWFESSFYITDSNGRRSGYAYDYQMKVAAYAGWSYTYVYGSWPELMQMLMEGKIDILSDVSYTDERAEHMLFTDLPMGSEEYCIFISPKNTEITADDFSTLNGKRIGVNKGSVQQGYYYIWAERHNVSAELVDLTCPESESLDMLNSGELDAYITPNYHIDPRRLVPLCQIGASDFFFAVNSERPDLLHELNSAMNRIQDVNPYYNRQLFEKYVQRTGSETFLSEEEVSWLSSHGKIRVGYQDNYLAFCSEDPETGELIGALKNYLEYIDDCIPNAHLEFEATAYPTSSAAFDALISGEVDCVFPANLNSYDSEAMHVLITPSLMRADIYAVVRQEDQQVFSKDSHVIVAVNKGNPNYTAFLQEYFPGWQEIYYSDTNECLKAVSDRVADCVLIAAFRYNNISRLCKKYRLTTYDTSVELDYCFAVAEGETKLYSILSKATSLIPTSMVNSALSFYIAEDAKLTFSEFLSDNMGLLMAIAAAVLLIILFLFMLSRRSEKKAKKLISATETDNLTGLYNRDYFFQYANRMYREHPEIARDAIVLNIEQFHSINALNGREFGDHVLQVLGNEIRTIAGEFGGIGGRFGADRFDIYCRHVEDYQTVFDRLQNKVDALSSNVSVRLRMGVMPWQEKIEPIQLFDQARTACNMARGHYMEHLIIFDEKVRERELFDQQILNDLRRALDDSEFEIYYQPKFDIRREEPKLVGAEALIRWNHPQLGMITPDRFIPLFERFGKITEVDKYVWAKAAHQVAVWKAKYGVTLPISVNLSRIDVFDVGLIDTLDDILAREKLGRNAFELEITESAYTENAEHLLRVAKALHRKGYVIEMDDFGTGYSSLNMLSAMPIDVLKMDREFIMNIENNEKDTQMVYLILGIAKNLNIPVIAEGVETASQLLLLKELGCSLVQGYYFSRPLHPADFEKRFLKNQ